MDIGCRLVLTDDDGRLRRVLLPRRRPRPPGPRTGPGSTAIVELAAPATLLAALDPDDHAPWAGLLRELRARLDQGVDGPPDRHPTPADAARRHPRIDIDRWVRIRDRRCVAPGCRRPAYAGDLDHTVDHALGGPSLSWNCGVWCRHHHRAKHDGGWRVTQPAPGRFHITTRAGARHVVEPPRIVDPLPTPRPADRPRPLPEHEQHPPGDDADDEQTPLARAVPSDPPDAHRDAVALVDPPPPF
ncbi:MAG TPA: HNH endonuclease signature motif containing protein [Actinomycetospora sp.]|nr:HNH endonuclease signature motif containing protein [Actinomycetospora sp.]